MTRTNVPLSGADQPTDEAACRRLMLSLFGEKAESLAAILLRSAEVESARSKPKPAFHAEFDAAEFAAFMKVVTHRANSIQGRATEHPKAEATKSNAASCLASISAIEPRSHRGFFPFSLAAAKSERFASLRSYSTAWALAAAALLVIIIGSSLLYRAHLDNSNIAAVPSSSFELSGGSKPAPAPVAPTPPQQ